MRNAFHEQQEGSSASYLGCEPGSNNVQMSDVGSLWSVEMHGSLHFIALVEKDSNMHLSLQFGVSPENGANVRLEPYSRHQEYEHRHWSLGLVPADPEHG